MERAHRLRAILTVVSTGAIVIRRGSTSWHCTDPRRQRLCSIELRPADDLHHDTGHREAEHRNNTAEDHDNMIDYARTLAIAAGLIPEVDRQRQPGTARSGQRSRARDCGTMAASRKARCVMTSFP